MNEFQGRNVFPKIFFHFPFWYDQMHSSQLFYIFLFFLSKQRGETLQAFWFLLPPRHCHITVTDTEKPRQPAACKILSFFKFDFGFEAGAQLRSWRESACQGKSLLHGEKVPRDHATFAVLWLRDKTGQSRKMKWWRTHTYIIMLMINSDD